ncbi:Sterile alpha motif (SAM) domain-containing protein [Heracleum sosnowskyi]|uniref:Sterile alpha motif (SAM) domain-containing protein n=1 Tax=Heracleum sosnowskyi TaxID=360622 RepID=A0AAD8IYJ2_9APIA|nr:Sterile alpha motif (SAM) domain-containing protein [Heracleum sosnowskyi]
MDWYSWLSKTGLDPLLTYKYGRIFTNSQLQENDITRFDHDFLQILGISVAKHRLEILKLSDKVNKDGTKLSIALAIRRTKSLLGKYWTRPRRTMLEQLRPWTSQWKKKETLPYNNKRHILKSGPMERTKEETYVLKNNRSVSKSGPVDKKMQERLMSTSWNSPSPLCGPQYRTHRETPLHEKKAFSESGDGVKWSSSPKVESHYTNKEIMSHDELGSIWSLMFEDIKPT